jgi:geranylgeranyl diphosphate synthase type I
VGDDLLSGKPTVLLAEAARILPAHLVARYLGPEGVTTPDDVSALQQLMLEAGVRERSEQRIATEVALASAALDGADLDSPAVVELRRLARTVAWRES